MPPAPPDPMLAEINERLARIEHRLEGMSVLSRREKSKLARVVLAARRSGLSVDEWVSRYGFTDRDPDQRG